MAGKLSKYEEVALKEIHQWKNPTPSRFYRLKDWVSAPFDAAGRTFNRIPGVEWVIQKTVGGLITLLNDGAQWSVRPDSIYSEFRKKGYLVNNSQDIFQLDLADVDKVLGALGAKYRSLSAIEGGGAGAIGLPGIPVDIVSTIFISLRAIGEYATYCGFETKLQSEQLFALGLLGYTSSPDQAAKNAAMAQLVKIAKDVASKAPWRDLQKSVFVQIVKQVANALGIRLTKQKLAQILPVVSSAIGIGFNAYFMGKVCDSAFFLYRERFLAAKYGPDVIEVVGKIPDDYASAFDDVLANVSRTDEISPELP